MPIPRNDEPSSEVLRAFDGVSKQRVTSDAESLHEAIQAAAELAVRELNLGPEEFEDFEVSRIQVVVGGNPNVKVYRVEITSAGGRG